MSSKSKRHRHRASFHGIEIKVQRAEVHLHQLQRDFDGLVDNGAYIFVPEKRLNGAEYLYRAHNPPPVDPRWGAIIGDCVHNLRSSLDHVATQLVYANNGTPSTTTKFPIFSHPPSRKILLWRVRKPMRVAGGVNPNALKIIEEVQPYNGTDTGMQLKLLGELDNFDKHRELIVTVGRVHTGSTYGDVGHPALNGEIKFTGQPVEHGKVVARVFYDPPIPEPDPNLSLRPYITFGRRGPIAGEIVVGVLGTLLWEVQNLTSQFLPFIPK